MSDADSQTGGTDDRFTQTSGDRGSRPKDEHTDQDSPDTAAGAEADADRD